jgi:CAAX protease family protein
MTTLLATNPSPWSWGRRFMRFPLTRIVLATFVTALSVGLSMSLTSTIAGKESELLGAGAALASYWIYVRLVEKRQVSELSHVRAVPELGAGLLIGALMVTAVVGVLAALGAYQVTGSGGFSMKLLTPLAEMTLVGVFEEVLCRGIIFGTLEKSLGSQIALLISALLFGLAHLPGAGAGFLAITIAVVAGAFFAAAYMLTRRLWLCIGIHIAWNYTLGTVFSIAVSGRENSGLLRGTLSGADWLSGGTYGLEASVFTLLVLTVMGSYFLWKARARGHLIAPFWRTAAVEK